MAPAQEQTPFGDAADRARAHRREDNGRVIGLMQRGGSLNSSDHAPAFGLLPSAARRAPGSELKVDLQVKVREYGLGQSASAKFAMQLRI